jgi:hypothetical protein
LTSDYHVKMTEENKDLITKLKIIGQAKKGYKLNTRTLQYQRANSAFASFVRSFISVNNRNDTMRMIKTVISQSLETLHCKIAHADQMSKFVAQTLIRDLVQAQTGINELQETYEDDTDFCCSMKTQNDFITAYLNSLRQTVPDLFIGVNESKNVHSFPIQPSPSIQLEERLMEPLFGIKGDNITSRVEKNIDMI